MGSVTGQELGLASGIINTSRQIGAGLGVALLVAILAGVGNARFAWAQERLRDDVNDVYQLPPQMATGILARSFAERSGRANERQRGRVGFDERAARLASEAMRTAYAWGFRGAALLVVLAVPLSRTMRRNPAQARREGAYAAAAADASPPSLADSPQPATT